MGILHLELDNLGDAMSHVDQCRDIRHRLYGDRHYKFLEVLHIMAEIFRLQEKWVEEAECYEEIILILEEIHGIDEVRTDYICKV